MRQDSLFGHVTLRLSAHPENVATESLLYLLQRHPGAWVALRSFLGLSGSHLPESLSFRTQAVGEDRSIPDMAGIDCDGGEVLLVEAKFWAGLTPSQPVAYLLRLPEHKPGCVVVVAPSSRFETLWPKLCAVCKDAGVGLQRQRAPAPGLRVADAAPGNVLALMTWPALLGVLRLAAEARGEAEFQSDVEQLSGLCSHVDREAFLPLQPNDTSPAIGRRVRQYAELVDTVVAALVADHGADTKNLSTGGAKSTYGRFFHFGGLGFFFAYCPVLWAQYWETPMWLSVGEADWSYTERIRNALSNALASDNRPVLVSEGRITVPIDLPLGVDQSDVVSAIIDQVRQIAVVCRPEMS